MGRFKDSLNEGFKKVKYKAANWIDDYKEVKIDEKKMLIDYYGDLYQIIEKERIDDGTILYEVKDLTNKRIIMKGDYDPKDKYYRFRSMSLERESKNIFEAVVQVLSNI